MVFSGDLKKISKISSECTLIGFVRKSEINQCENIKDMVSILTGGSFTWHILDDRVHSPRISVCGTSSEF